MSPDDLVQALISALGYRGMRGYFQVHDLPRIARYRHVIGEAFRELRIVGVFGLCGNSGDKEAEYIPLVYVATARNAIEAREIHRATWSQGVVPFLIVTTGKEVWSCNGFAFASENWEHHNPPLPGDVFKAGMPLPNEIAHLAARSLRTSVVWTDREMGFDGRVDMHLLDNLRGLEAAMLRGRSVPALPTKVANALIGRFLYIRFLRDRAVIPEGWLPLLERHHARHHAGTLVEDMWTSFSKIERVFNGSMFPISAASRAKVEASHVRQLKSVLLEGEDLIDGRQQITFQEFRFSSIRTETLSAVYELFIEASNPDRHGRDGAIYTPPFLVDFVLSKVERDGTTLGRNDRVFDCAAGSGLFLVGAFRRIIESSLRDRQDETLPLSMLHALLRRCIWGIERDPDACHVAAFSLYLTMLDYVERGEISAVLAHKGRRKVFPTLVGRNILSRDFFDSTSLPPGFPRKFDIVIANPPWQKTVKNGAAARAYQTGPRGKAIDRNRVAGLFFWKSIDEYLSRTGRFGFVMSGRALLSSGAARFPQTLISDVGLTNAVNLSHMRRKLFPRAEHPAVVITGFKDPAHAGEGVHVSSPLLSSQPLGRNGTPWTIVEDRCGTEVFRRDRLRIPQSFIEALILRPIDRQIAHWLADCSATGKALTLGRVLDLHGLSIKRGGYQPETGISKEYTLGADQTKANYYRRALGLEAMPQLLVEGYEFPPHATSNIADAYQAPFGGNIVVVPRGMAFIDFVERPFAFNSSINAIFATRPRTDAVPLLRAIAKYLNSEFANYCLALFGRDWAIDERRFEQKELRQLPLPIAYVDIRRAAEFADQLDQLGEQEIYREFSLSRSFRQATEEFANFRLEFQNGLIPEVVHHLPEQAQLNTYIEVLEREMATYIGGGRKFIAKMSHVEERSVAVIFINYLRSQGHSQETMASPAAALQEFDRDGANVFQNSAWFSYDSGSLRFSVIKPLSRVHWTVDRAIADAEMLLSETLSLRRQAAIA
jgi:hypothetical protein